VLSVSPDCEYEKLKIQMKVRPLALAVTAVPLQWAVPSVIHSAYRATVAISVILAAALSRHWHGSAT
jgi:hypothetical protein